MTKETQSRKRGIELEEAIYTVALQIFDEQGINTVTFNNIAQQAETSRSVLYRRWDSPSSLLVDAVHHFAHKKSGYLEDLDEESFPDCGSLRADLLENAKQISLLHDQLNHYFVKLSLYQAINGETLRDDLLDQAESGAIRLGTIIAKRAISRGELKRIPTKEVLMLLGNLRRYYTFLNPNQMPSEETMIDNIILPAWLAHQTD